MWIEGVKVNEGALELICVRLVRAIVEQKISRTAHDVLVMGQDDAIFKPWEAPPVPEHLLGVGIWAA